MKSLPEITVKDWLDAEEQLKRDQVDKLEDGEVLTVTFAKSQNISTVRARARLLELYYAGRATRRRFFNGSQGVKYAYKLCRNGTSK